MKNFYLRILLCIAMALPSVNIIAQNVQKLSGRVIGTEHSVDYDTNKMSTTKNTKDMVFDGNYNTFFASYDRSGTWVGLDLGEPHIITKIGWSPRIAGQGPQRCQLAVFEGANDPDFLDAVPLYVVAEAKETKVMHYKEVKVSRGFRYVRYVGPNDARCNLAELAFYGYAGKGDNSQFYQVTNLPTVSIHTYSGENPQKKGEDFDSNVTIIYDGGKRITEQPIQTRVRGNGSQTFPKKPYRMKFIGKSQHVLKDSPLESPAKAKKWTLINNYGDKSLLRNLLAFEMSRRIQFDYTPWGQPVDVIMNGEYQGSYQLCDQITIDPHRVDITEMEPTDTEHPAITGGYLVEIDAYAKEEEPQSWFTSSRGIPVTIQEPDEDGIVPAQYNYIKGFFNEMESRLFSSNYIDPEMGYRSRLDLESFLKHFIIGEFAGNLDTYWSVYLYKDRYEDIFHVGPCWDFDLAFDNARAIYPINDRNDWIYPNGSAAGNMKSFVNKILSDPTAYQELRRIWKRTRDSGAFNSESLNAYVDSIAQVLDQSQALNFTRWKILSTAVHSNPRVPKTYKEEIEFVKNYVKNRIEWIDKKLNYTPTLDDGQGRTFEIATADELVNFSMKVYNGMIHANAVLTADISLTNHHEQMIPIGTIDNPYKGTFDGQGHVVKNIANMLFGTTNGATIKNVGITSGRVEENFIYAAYTGTLVGHCLDSHPTTITNCYSKAYLTGATKDAGGLVGKLHGTLSYSFYNGIIRGESILGGLVGSSYSNNKSATIDHCHMAGTKIRHSGDASQCGALIGLLHDGSLVYRSYSLDATTVLVGTNNGNITECNFHTEEEFENGSVCWLLNDCSEKNPVWYQTLGRDSSPLLDDTHGVVIYKNGTYTNLEGNSIVNSISKRTFVDVYDIRGRLVRKATLLHNCLEGLPHGVYIVNGKKIVH